MGMRSYFQIEPHERAKLTEEEVAELVEIELMIAGVVRPKPLPPKKTRDEVPLERTPAYRITYGGHSTSAGSRLAIAFRTEAEAQSFLAMRPLVVHDDWETRTQYAEPLKDAGAQLELLPSKESVDLFRDELRAVASINNTYDHDFSVHRAAQLKVEKIVNGVRNDWEIQRERFGKFQEIQRDYIAFTKLAKGDADMALACLRKAHGVEQVSAAAEWLGDASLARVLPGDVVTPPTLVAADMPKPTIPHEDIPF